MVKPQNQMNRRAFWRPGSAGQNDSRKMISDFDALRGAPLLLPGGNLNSPAVSKKTLAGSVLLTPQMNATAQSCQDIDGKRNVEIVFI